jgi:hypothetical protein
MLGKAGISTFIDFHHYWTGSTNCGVRLGQQEIAIQRSDIAGDETSTHLPLGVVQQRLTIVRL